MDQICQGLCSGWRSLWCYSSLQASTLNSHWKMEVEYLTNNEELLKHREKIKFWHKWWRSLIGWNFRKSARGPPPPFFATVLTDNDIVRVFLTHWIYIFTVIKLWTHLFDNIYTKVKANAWEFLIVTAMLLMLSALIKSDEKPLKSWYACTLMWSVSLFDHDNDDEDFDGDLNWDECRK